MSKVADLFESDDEEPQKPALGMKEKLAALAAQKKRERVRACCWRCARPPQ